MNTAFMLNALFSRHIMKEDEHSDLEFLSQNVQNHNRSPDIHKTRLSNNADNKADFVHFRSNKNQSINDSQNALKSL